MVRDDNYPAQTSKEPANIYLVNIKTIEQKIIYALKDEGDSGNYGLSSAIIDPTGKFVALATYSFPNEQYKYELILVNVDTLEVKKLESPDEWWSLKGWKDANTIQVEKLIKGETYETVPVDISVN